MRVLIPQSPQMDGYLSFKALAKYSATGAANKHVEKISSGIVAGRTYFPEILAKIVSKTMRGGVRLRIISDCNGSYPAKFLENVKATYFVPRELT
jgi:hypothetical protein